MITENTQIDSTNTTEIRGEQTIALQAWLAATYPATFSPDTPVPLKIGVFEDLRTRHPDLDPATLRRALTRYCARPRYQKTLARDGAVRVDLDGNPAGDVEESHRKFAQVKLAHWNGKQGTKSAAQATPAPVPAPTPKPPEQPPPTPLAGRPILQLKKPGAVTAVTVTRREVKP